MDAKNYQKPLQALFSLLGLVLLLVWMQGGFSAKVSPGAAQAGEKGRTAAVGATAKVEASEFDELMRWPGAVSARSVAQIAPKVPARILAINVKTGDSVQAGQVLARLDPSELQSRVSQARSALAAGEAQSGKAQSDLRRAQSLYDQEAATLQTLEAAQAAARASGAQVAEARAAIAAAESLLAETELRAPFDGAVVKRNLEPGDMAMPGSPVLTVQSGRNLRVEAAIPESCGREIRRGDRLKAQVAGQDYPVTVEEVSPAVDPQTRTLLVKAALDAAAQPGAFAWLEQSCGRRKLLSIPAAAVTRSGQLESVGLVKDGEIRLRHIRTGSSFDGRVEVLSGLKEGDTVALRGKP